jgi:MFS family permease
VTAVWTGFNFGNMMGLLVAPFCVARWGWESVFYVFGTLGLVWSLGWYLINRGTPLPSKAACSRFEYVRAGEALKRIQEEEAERAANRHSEKIPYRRHPPAHPAFACLCFTFSSFVIFG